MNNRFKVLGWGGSVVLHAALAAPLLMGVGEPPPPPAEVPLEITVATEEPMPAAEQAAEDNSPPQPVAEAVAPTPPQPVQASEPPPPMQTAEPPPVQTAEPPPTQVAEAPPPVQAVEPPPPEPAPEPPPEVAEALPEPPPPAPPPPPRPVPPRPAPPRPVPPRPQIARPVERPVERADPNLQAYAAPAVPVAPAAPAAPSRPRAAAAGPPPDWRQKFSAAIARAQRYPSLAQQRGIEGTPSVTFQMRSDGTLIFARLASSSGSELLDQAALETLQRANLPPLPTELGVETLLMTVPIRFNFR